MVAPFMGAWIETPVLFKCSNAVLSLPSWERGLKPFFYSSFPYFFVAPFMGAWIETLNRFGLEFGYDGRSLHGSVD